MVDIMNEPVRVGILLFVVLIIYKIIERFLIDKVFSSPYCSTISCKDKFKNVAEKAELAQLVKKSELALVDERTQEVKRQLIKIDNRLEKQETNFDNKMDRLQKRLEEKVVF